MDISNFKAAQLALALAVDPSVLIFSGFLSGDTAGHFNLGGCSSSIRRQWPSRKAPVSMERS